MDINKNRYTAFFAPAIVCFMALLLSSCELLGGSNTNIPAKPVKAPPSQQVYVAPILGASDITTFDPALAYDASSITAIQMVFTGLLQPNDNLQVLPNLAHSWVQSPNGRPGHFT